jgi:dCMP deaminase
MTTRPDWDSYFMGIARISSKRSTCLRGKTGAVLVRERRVLTTGYNGPPKGLKHCSETGCVRERECVPDGERLEITRGLHSTQNTIIQAAVFGISIKDSTLYTTHPPCTICTRMLINAGIRKIIMDRGFPQELSLRLLEEAGIELVSWDQQNGCIEP